MTWKKHFLLFVPFVFFSGLVSSQTESEARRLLDQCRAHACQGLPILANNLGSFYYSAGRYRDAEPFFKEASAMGLTAALVNLRQQGRGGDAEPRFQRAIEILRLYPPAPELGAALTNLGNTLMMRGAYREAQEYLREGGSVFEKVLGPSHPKRAAALSNLA